MTNNELIINSSPINEYLLDLLVSRYVLREKEKLISDYLRGILSEEEYFSHRRRLLCEDDIFDFITYLTENKVELCGKIDICYCRHSRGNLSFCEMCEMSKKQKELRKRKKRLIAFNMDIFKEKKGEISEKQT